MAEPVGTWRFNANGYKGTLDINGDGQGNLTGTVMINPGSPDRLKGIWNEATREIVFQRIVRGGTDPFVQTHIGYLYTTKEPIFKGHGLERPEDVRLMTGYFGSISPPSDARGRAVYGWVAWQHI